MSLRLKNFISFNKPSRSSASEILGIFVLYCIIQSSLTLLYAQNVFFCANFSKMKSFDGILHLGRIRNKSIKKENLLFHQHAIISINLYSHSILSCIISIILFTASFFEVRMSLSHNQLWFSKFKLILGYTTSINWVTDGILLQKCGGSATFPGDFLGSLPFLSISRSKSLNSSLPQKYRSLSN